LLVPLDAHAQEGPLVVVITSSPEAPFVRRLAAELSLFGYRVEVSERGEGEDDLDALLARSGGAALIAVDQGRQIAEVIVAERAGVGPARRERERLDPRRRADTNAVVLAERFRARLTELGIAPGPATVSVSPEPPLPEPVPVSVVENERRLWVAAGAGASSGGLGLMPDFELEVRAFPAVWLSTSAFGKVAPFGREVRQGEGSANVRLLSAGVLIDAYPVRGPLQIHVGLGALLVSASMQGSASPPYAGREDTVLVPGGMFETGAALRLSPRVSGELRAYVGACSPRVAVRFAERKVADYGQPFAGVLLGVAVGVF
jgi:Fe2+ transport system protein FeoA